MGSFFRASRGKRVLSREVLALAFKYWELTVKYWELSEKYGS